MLESKVTTLKQLAIEMGEEIKDQNKLLSNFIHNNDNGNILLHDVDDKTKKLKSKNNFSVNITFMILILSSTFICVTYAYIIYICYYK
ncbi:MAG: t-SNARE domain-containing protein [Cotesia congregata filamentous virus 2]